MPSRVVTGPLAEPIALAEAKTHCRVTDTGSDTELAIYISSARAWVENFTHRSLVLQSLEQAHDSFPACIELLRAPVFEVSAIQYIDSNGILQTLAATEYTVDTRTEPPRIIPAYGKSWPGTREDPSAVRVTYLAGYLTPFTADAGTDTLAATGHPYSNGDVLRLSNSGGALPGGLAANTDYYVVSAATNSLQLALTAGGAAINLTTAGSGTHYLGELPPEIRQALLLLVGEFDQRRETAIAGVSIGEVPFSARALLWPHRMDA